MKIRGFYCQKGFHDNNARMSYLVFKYLVTAAVIVAASELAKTSDKIGALVISLPLMTILTLVWLNVDGAGAAKVSNHAYYTFWYVLPTLPMFLAFPRLLERFGFWPSLAISAVGTAALFLGYAMVMRKFGIELLP